MDDYNGWKNRATWNAALWINNDYELYTAAVAFMKAYTGSTPYKAFIDQRRLTKAKTPDNIAWISPQMDIPALDEMLRELIDG